MRTCAWNKSGYLRLHIDAACLSMVPTSLQPCPLDATHEWLEFLRPRILTCHWIPHTLRSQEEGERASNTLKRD